MNLSARCCGFVTGPCLPPHPRCGNQGGSLRVTADRVLMAGLPLDLGHDNEAWQVPAYA
jgi:hypothetical protein